MRNNFKTKDKTLIIYVKSQRFGDKEVYVDVEDFDKVNSIKGSWYLRGHHNKECDGVITKIQKNKKRKVVTLHNLIMDCPSDKIVDHRDGNVFNNRKNNLRIVTPQENATNLSSISKNKSGYRNIYIEQGRYRVRINRKSFGTYQNIEEAIKRRNKEIKLIFPLRER